MSFNEWKHEEFGKVPYDWGVSKLGNHITTLTDYHANGSYEKLKENVELLDDEDYAIMIRTTNFEQNSFDRNSFKYITKSAYEFLEKSKVFPNDILMNKIANAGSVYLMPNLKRPVSLAMNLFLIRINNNEINQKYAYYFLKNYEAYVKTRASGSVTKTITKENVRNLEIAYPNIMEQNSIVSILSAIDKKVELNNQMNKKLEETAQAIFKSWIVDLVPFKDGELEESEIGLIPKGWRVGCLNDIVNQITKTCHRKEIPSGSRYIGLEHIPRRQLVLCEYGDIEEVASDKLSFSQYDLLFGKIRPYFHKVSIAPWDGYCSTDVIVLAPKIKEFYGYAVLTIYSDIFVQFAVQISQGTKMPRAEWKVLKDYKLIIPPDDIMHSFNNVILPILERMLLNSEESSRLVQIRDTILPKLMSGTIRVPLEVNI